MSTSCSKLVKICKWFVVCSWWPLQTMELIYACLDLLYFLSYTPCNILITSRYWTHCQFQYLICYNDKWKQGFNLSAQDFPIVSSFVCKASTYLLIRVCWARPREIGSNWLWMAFQNIVCVWWSNDNLDYGLCYMFKLAYHRCFSESLGYHIPRPHQLVLNISSLIEISCYLSKFPVLIGRSLVSMIFDASYSDGLMAFNLCYFRYELLELRGW